MILVQISNPKYRKNEDFSHIGNVDDFLYDVFEFPTEHLLVMWDGFYLYLDYKYDIFLSIDTFFDIINDLISNKNGIFSHHFYSDSFSCTWNFAVDKAVVEICMEWNLKSHRRIESVDFGNITIDKENLINELSEIPRFLNDVIENSIVSENLKKEWGCKYNNDIRNRNRGLLYS